VKLAFAGEQTVAEDRARDHAQHRTFDEIFGTLDQNLRNEVRRIYQDDIDPAKLGAADTRDVGAQAFNKSEAVEEKRMQDARKPR